MSRAMKNAPRGKAVKPERLAMSFAVFNLHINNAGKRADAEYIAQFGQEDFDKHIKPFHDQGIMSILKEQPTPRTMGWVMLVTAYVNEDRQ